MNDLWVFCDVDLTLIDKDDTPRPHLVEFLKELKRLKTNLVIWSAGGMYNRDLTYAEAKIGMVSNKLQIDLKPFVRSFLSKGVKLLVPKPVFYIDDSEDLIQHQQREGNGVFKIRAFESSLMPRDTELFKASKAVATFIDKQKKLV